MMDEMRDKFKSMWSPNQQMTVDESMVMYKGKYCPVWQYMPKKPVQFGINVWVAVDAISKYLWNFQVYCGKDGNPYNEDVASDLDLEYGELEGNDKQGVEKGNGLQGRNIVKDLMADLGGRRHIVTTDNFFTSVPLYLDLLENGIMATGTLRANKKYVPHSMYAKKITKKKTMGWVDYRMHDEGKICCIMVWKDKQAVYFLSTHAEPILEEGTKPFVWRKIGGKRKKVRTGPMHLQYTRNMRGVDVADQLLGVYSCLTRSHKWWHHIFFYMLDTTVCNMWIIHSDLSFWFLDEPLTHQRFQL
jgi:hypothetical protein